MLNELHEDGGDMTKDELIVMQQLEIEEYKQKIHEFENAKDAVRHELYNIGAPLNDNCNGFDFEQRKVLHRIAEHLDIR